MKMKIEPVVTHGLLSFELSELTRLIEAVETETLYLNGLHRLCGGFANITANDLVEEDDGESVLLSMEFGVQDEDGKNADTVNLLVSRKVLGDKTMSLKEKMNHVS